MKNLKIELESKLFEVVSDHQAKAQAALTSLKQVSKFLEDNGKEGFDLAYVEELIDTMDGSNWIHEVEVIQHINTCEVA
jgi:hypothetical protein